MQRGIDFKDSFAPTLRGTSLRILFSLAAELQLQVHHMDFENAYLNADVDELPSSMDTVSVSLPESSNRRIDRTRITHTINQELMGDGIDKHTFAVTIMKSP